MPSVRVIRRRIKSVQNTSKITQAMSSIAAIKMRKAQQRVLAARPYSDKVVEVLGALSARGADGLEGEGVHPLLEKRPTKKIQVVHITSDRGLCGGMNGNLNRQTGSYILRETHPVSVVTVGKKGRDFMIRFGRDVKAVFTDLGDAPRLIDTTPIAQVVVDDYTKGETDEVYLAYTQFVNNLVQRPVLKKLLPIEPSKAPEGEKTKNVDFIFEPSTDDVFSRLLPRYVDVQIYHAVLETIASEQSARMVAMRNASENAKDMITSLTLEMNKARQEQITKELLDITGGVAAMEN